MADIIFETYQILMVLKEADYSFEFAMVLWAFLIIYAVSFVGHSLNHFFADFGYKYRLCFACIIKPVSDAVPNIF